MISLFFFFFPLFSSRCLVPAAGFVGFVCRNVKEGRGGWGVSEMERGRGAFWEGLFLADGVGE